MGLFTRKKQPLPVSTPELLAELIEDGDVLVDFTAPGNGPCRQMSGLIKELAHELDGRVEVVVIDVNQSPELAKRHGVRSVPTLLVFRDGKPRQRFNGLTDRKRILTALGARDLV